MATTDYGTDVSTFVLNDEGEADLDPYFGLISGLRVVAEHAVRGITMEHGEMWDAPDEGYDIRNHVSARFDRQGAKAFRVASAVENEIETDERVASCDVTVQPNLATRTLLVAGEITTVEGETFPLVADIGQVTVELLSAPA